MSPSKTTAFDAHHPLVPFACMATLLVFCMTAFQPVLIALSFAGALSYNIYLCGWRRAALTLRWQLFMVAIIAVFNPFFSAMGSTELFRIGVAAIYLESLVYGACMGFMLVSMMLWFSDAAHVLSTDKLMALFGRFAPTFSLMVSMANRLVPRFVARSADIAAVQDACMSGSRDAAGRRAASQLRQTSVLMAWSMEDSLEMADAMRARGWRSDVRRTSYNRFRMHAFDVAFLALFAVLVAVDAAIAFAACSGYSFYPALTPIGFWWGYVPYALLVFLPMIMQVGERLRWMR